MNGFLLCILHSLLLHSHAVSDEEVYGNPGNATIASMYEPLEQNSNEGNISSWDEINRLNNISEQAEEAKEEGRVSAEEYLLQSEAKTLHQLSEGDILLDEKDRQLQAESIDPYNVGFTRRSMIPYLRKLWFTRVIPYEIIHEGTTRASPDKVRSVITESLAEIMQKTCLVFRARNYGDTNWLRFFKGSGCYSGIGRKYWTQSPTKISLGEYCVHRPIVLHEVLHSIGFFHEQSRSDRDSFINIRWQNINPSMRDQFTRHLSYDATIQNTPYDYLSIMHYGKTAFSNNGLNTLEAKFDNNQPLGGKELTQLDAEEINRMYQCEKKRGNIENGAWSDWTDWTADCFELKRKGCMRIRQRFCLSSNYQLCPGVDQFGVQDDEIQCPPKNCTIELLKPHWGQWGPYTPCSKTCGEGIQTRSRRCDNPPPHHGLFCTGYKSQTSLCRTRKCYKDYMDSDFESGFGMWKQDRLEALDWKIIQGPTPNIQSGPKGDHTSKFGQYIYLSATNPFRHNNKVGRLISRIIKPSYGSLCVTFFYQLNGKSIGYLDFFTKTIKTSKFHTYWSRKGHQGNFWRKGAFTIPAKTDDYEIVIEGRVGIAPHSDIALDDVQLDRGICVDGSEGCNDYYKGCTLWKLHGECYKNYRWMLRSCCSTCAGMAECSNIYGDPMCTAWASKDECVNNPKWMWMNCCKACRGCMDKHKSCKNWASKGECNKNVWMKINCKTSCNICRS